MQPVISNIRTSGGALHRKPGGFLIMENRKEKPNYYAIIPAPVRYCKNLESKAGYLYGEITALSNKQGYCWATNGYFSELYNVHKNTISSWIQSLKKEGFIKIEEIQIENGSFQRRISISENMYPPQRKYVPPSTESLLPLNENSEHNIKDNNTTNNTIKRKNFSPGKTLKKTSNYTIDEIPVEAEKKKKKKVPQKKKVIIYPWNTAAFINAWTQWKQFKKEQHNFTYKGTISEQIALDQLKNKSENKESAAIEIIQYSIGNAYKGLFKPHDMKSSVKTRTLNYSEPL